MRVEHQIVHSAAAEEMQVRSVKTCNKLLSSTDFLRSVCWNSEKWVTQLSISLAVYHQEKWAGADVATTPSLHQHLRQAVLLL